MGLVKDMGVFMFVFQEVFQKFDIMRMLEFFGVEMDDLEQIWSFDEVGVSLMFIYYFNVWVINVLVLCGVYIVDLGSGLG